MLDNEDIMCLFKKRINPTSSDYTIYDDDLKELSILAGVYIYTCRVTCLHGRGVYMQGNMSAFLTHISYLHTACTDAEHCGSKAAKGTVCNYNGPATLGLVLIRGVASTMNSLKYTIASNFCWYMVISIY